MRTLARWLPFFPAAVLLAALGCENSVPSDAASGGATAGSGAGPSGSGGMVTPGTATGGSGTVGSGGMAAEGTGGMASGGASGAVTGGVSGAATGGAGATVTGGASGTAAGGASGTATGGATGTATGGTSGTATGGAGGKGGSAGGSAGTMTGGTSGVGTGGAGGSAPGRAQVYANFDAGTSIAPFRTCWDWAPSYIKVIDKSLEFFYSQAAYDADPRRERKGAEICADFETFTDGWYGFKLFLPSPGFPTNSTTIITQVFQKGACNSWGAHLDVHNRDLVVQHRSSCGTPTEAVVYPNLPLNTWIPIVMYFKASNNGNGAFRVWVNRAPQATPSYDRTNINFGFGQWTNGTTLAAGNALTHKMGIYTQAGGDKRIRFDEISLQTGNPPDAFERVTPRP